MTATLYSQTNGVATITLNEPDNRNALSGALVESLTAHLAQAIADSDVRVIVLTNAGRVFCAGADLRESNREARTANQSDGFAELLVQILDSPKPVVGRIAGHCSGGGVGLAAACDISVAVDTAKFGFTEARIGVAPAMISVVCLPKLSPTDARELFLRANRISATRAADVRLINYAVDTETLDTAIDEIVDDLRAGGPAALAACKDLLSQVPQLDRSAAFKWTSELSTALFSGEEAASGMAAFLAKEPAPWAK